MPSRHMICPYLCSSGLRGVMCIYICIYIYTYIYIYIYRERERDRYNTVHMHYIYIYAFIYDVCIHTCIHVYWLLKREGAVVLAPW